MFREKGPTTLHTMRRIRALPHALRDGCMSPVPGNIARASFPLEEVGHVSFPYICSLNVDLSLHLALDGVNSFP